MAELIIAVCLAIIVSAGCSLFEAVLYSVPLRHIETMVHEGRQSGKIFKELRSDIERPITAILSLNTIANTAGAAVAGAAALAVFGHHWLGYFSVFFTLAILIFSEVIPKTAGVIYARPLVPFVAFPLKGLVKIMTPAVWLCSHITRLISKNKSQQEPVSSEELKTMARLSLRTGGIKQYQEIVIDNILSLDTRTVKGVMTPRTVIFSLSEHLSLEKACGKSTSWEHSRFPVYDKDSEDIVGIVLTKELFLALAESRKDEHLTELMRPVHFVVETASLNNVLMEFMGSREQLFVVIDEYGGLSGIITLEDILEEILGREIIDESDKVADKRRLARQQRSELISRAPHDS
ncbi:MAG: HlyC/CorC family transporter [Deltaproteobacteria bacterium]|nr:HlyC/CorC family transporter [Deltaproteobacteria bacterium]MBW1912145.1 HlyC/CorC family transporter [Deltaproteobacteria bacterium]